MHRPRAQPATHTDLRARQASSAGRQNKKRIAPPVVGGALEGSIC
jgi:hypothetical protein